MKFNLLSAIIKPATILGVTLQFLIVILGMTAMTIITIQFISEQTTQIRQACTEVK